MKVVLLILSGDPTGARERLHMLFPEAEIESLARAEVESSTYRKRLKALRARRPDVFVIATERLAWQRGQNALMLFGALAGASRFILLDTRGDMRDEARAQILLKAPFRIAAELAKSALAIANSHFHLKQLESAVRLRASTVSHKSAAKNSDALRIAYLRSTPSAGTQAGGAATHISGFVSAVAELIAGIRVISNDYLAGIDRTDLTMIGPDPDGTTRAAFDLRNNLIFSAGVLREIEHSPADLIYQRYSRFTWAGVEASLCTGVPLFLEYNGSEVWIGKHWDMSGMIPLLERFERLNLNAAARIFVVAEVERRNLLRAGIADEKIVVNPNGVDTEKFRPGVGGAAVRGELGVAPDETLAGFVGTFGPWHGVLTLARAITLLPADSRVRFLLVGAGKLCGEVQRIIGAEGKQQQVIFTGHVEHERVPALLDACDILLSPHVSLEDGSEFFGSPTKLFEYMAMGKGIVASRLGQIGDVLSDQETALLTEPGNARELADAILQLSGSPALRRRLGAAAREAAIERHTWKRNAGRVLESYRDWIEARREK
jgi:glycosyltransferase involved in cell wall biosynthesis